MALLMSPVPLNKGALSRAGTRLRTWLTGWWDGWLGTKMILLTPDHWFQLWKVPEPRLWVLPPAAMETIMEVFNEDRLAHP